jgi:hypothetical protein
MYVTCSPAFSCYSYAHIRKVNLINCCHIIMECNLLYTIFAVSFFKYFLIKIWVYDIYKDFVNWVDIKNHSLLCLLVKLRLCCAAGWNVTLLRISSKKTG